MGEEIRLGTRIPVRRPGEVGHHARRVLQLRIRAPFDPIVPSVWIRRVEVRFEVFHRRDGVLLGRAPTPQRIAVAPMRERNVPGRGRDGAFHRLDELAIGVEGDRVWRPVEAVFVEAIIGREGKLLQVKRAGRGGIEAVTCGFGGLKHEIDRVGGIVVLRREEFHVNLLSVVAILWGRTSANGFSRTASRA